jgi:hypothetical protein
MSRPAKGTSAVPRALVDVAAGMSPADAARKHNVAPSSISRALRRTVCPFCGHPEKPEPRSK